MQRAVDKDELAVSALVAAPVQVVRHLEGLEVPAATNRTGTRSPASESVISVEPDPDRQTIPSRPPLRRPTPRVTRSDPPTEPPTSATFDAHLTQYRGRLDGVPGERVHGRRDVGRRHENAVAEKHDAVAPVSQLLAHGSQSHARPMIVLETTTPTWPSPKTAAETSPLDPGNRTALARQP